MNKENTDNNIDSAIMSDLDINLSDLDNYQDYLSNSDNYIFKHSDIEYIINNPIIIETPINTLHFDSIPLVLTISACGQYLLTGLLNGIIFEYNIDDLSQPKLVIKTLNEKVRCLDYSNDGNIIAAG